LTDIQHIFLYVFNGYSDWEPSYAITGINDPTYQLFPGKFIVHTISSTKEPKKTLGGITILPDFIFSEINPDECALLLLPGGPGWDTEEHNIAIQYSRKLLELHKPIAAICGATFGLAKSGLLDAVNHTSNAAIYLEATGYKGKSYYQETQAIIDNNIITANGTAPIEFAYQIFKRLNIYSEKTLDAWLGLYKTGDIKYFLALQNYLQNN
jgi:putative intracellular protease/amidase